jgi:hypothetical protein
MVVDRALDELNIEGTFDGITEHRFAMDQIVSWEKPMNVYESEA